MSFSEADTRAAIMNPPYTGVVGPKTSSVARKAPALFILWTISRTGYQARIGDVACENNDRSNNNPAQ